MARKTSKPTIKQPGVVIVNPAASPSIKVDTTMPYSPVPFTTYNGEPARPLTAPKLRQLAPSKNVKIQNPRGL